MDKQDKIIENLEKCPNFEKCNQNLCPLDLELSKRSGGQRDKCRFAREQQTAKIAEKTIEFGGRLMPDCTLNLVPRENLDSLNKASQARWHEIKKDVLSENIKNEV